jgi:hypothetical protein
MSASRRLIGRATLWALATSALACGATEDSEVLAAPAPDAALTPACATLTACCPELPSEVVTSCKQLAAQAGETECSAELAALAPQGRCAPRTSTGGDAGSKLDATTDAMSAPSDAGDAGAVACTLLTACCASPALPGSNLATCQSVQGAGAEAECAALLSTLTASSECAGGAATAGGACPDLQACCASESLPAADSTSCLGTASAGVDTDCSAQLQALTSAGFCAGVASDGGQPTTPDCMTLSMCCGEIAFPAGTLTTCQHLVAANVDGSCLSAYESYAALGYCQ